MSGSRVFFFNRYVYPDHSATSQLLTDLARHLAATGEKVLLVGSRQRYDDPDASLAAQETADGFEIRRIGGSRFGRGSLVGRALDYLTYIVGAARLLWHEVQPGDRVVLMTDPPMLGAVLGPLASRRGAICIHWLQDVFPEVAEVLLGRLWSGWRTAPLRWVRDLALRTAARVVVISPGMADRIVAMGVACERIDVIENWTDDETIRAIPPDANPLREAWGLQKVFVVGYSGNLGRAHDWRTMLEVADALRHRSDIAFVLIGGGRGQQAFAAAAAERSLGNVSLRPYQTREALALSLCVPDLHWLSLLPALEGLILPSKLYGILAAGRPALFIGDPEGEVATHLRTAEAGIAIAPNDVAAAVAVLERLADEPGLLAGMGAAARRALEDSHTREHSLRSWSRLLGGSVLCRRRSS